MVYALSFLMCSKNGYAGHDARVSRQSAVHRSRPAEQILYLASEMRYGGKTLSVDDYMPPSFYHTSRSRTVYIHMPSSFYHKLVVLVHKHFQDRTILQEFLFAIHFYHFNSDVAVREYLNRKMFRDSRKIFRGSRNLSITGIVTVPNVVGTNGTCSSQERPIIFDHQSGNSTKLGRHSFVYHSNSLLRYEMEQNARGKHDAPFVENMTRANEHTRRPSRVVPLVIQTSIHARSSYHATCATVK